MFATIRLAQALSFLWFELDEFRFKLVWKSQSYCRPHAVILSIPNQLLTRSSNNGHETAADFAVAWYSSGNVQCAYSGAVEELIWCTAQPYHCDIWQKLSNFRSYVECKVRSCFNSPYESMAADDDPDPSKAGFSFAELW